MDYKRLIEEELSFDGHARSEAYQLGVYDELRRLRESIHRSYPYQAGSSKSDAYLAGLEKGRELYEKFRRSIYY